MAKKQISIRARKYIKNKVAGMSDYQAALNAGYSKAIAKNASIKLEKGGIKEALETLMDKKGLTDDYLLEKTKDGLDNAVKIHGTDDNFVEIPDYAVKHKYLETALKLKGHLKSKEEPKGNTFNFQQIITDNEKYRDD